jgi:hypothetical protein
MYAGQWQELTESAILRRIEEQEVPMATLNISLPDSRREFVDQQVAAGGYSTASEYIRDLIRQAQ